MKRLLAASLALLVGACVSGTSARGQDAPPPPVVREVAPPLYYMEDEQGRLVPVPGFRYRDFMELFRIKEGLAGPALPPAAVLERIAVRIDARGLAAEGREASAPAAVECVVRQSRGGWAAVSLGLEGLLLSEPPTHEGPGRMVIDAEPGGGYRCWFEATAEAGGDARHVVTLVGRLPVDAVGARESFDLRMPTAIASLVELVTERVAPAVTVRPHAAGRVEVAAGEDGGTVRVTGLSGDVRIGLAEAAAGAVVAAAEAECEGTVRIDGRNAVIDAVIRVRNLPPGPPKLRITLPPRTTLANVRGGVVVTTGGTPEKPLIEFAAERSPAGEVALELTCERPVDPSGGTPVEPLGFVVEGIEPWRQWGRTMLVIDGDWQAAWNDAAGLRRIDVPPGERPAGFVAAFAYDAQPASLPLRILPRRSRVVIEPEYRYRVSATRVTLAVRLRVAARGAPVGAVALTLDPSWSVDDVGPAGLVDAPALGVEQDRVTVPLLQPLAGDAVVELRASRTINRDVERLEWTLPVPRADLVGPAEVVVGSDADIELVPDNERIEGLVRRTSPVLVAADADQTALAYRLDAPAGVFAATRRFLPRRVEASVAARVSVTERELVVEETVRLEVLHVPLEFLEFVVPGEIIASGTLEVRQGPALLDTVELPAAEGAESGRPTLRALLPVPLLGEGDVKISYRLPPPAVPTEATVAADLPLVLPLGGVGGRQTAVIEESPALTVGVRGDAWRRESPLQPGGPRAWATGKAQQVLPLTISLRPAEAEVATVVEATWIRTRLSPGRREEIVTLVMTGRDRPLEIRLPESGLADRDVRIDGRPFAGLVGQDGTIVVEPAPDPSHPRLIEIRSVAPWGGTAAGLGLPWPVPLAGPTFPGDVRQRRFYQEVIAPADDHLLGVPAGWTAQQTWHWTGRGVSPRPAVGPDELAAWMAAAAGDESLARRLVAADPPLAENRFVYVGVGPPGGGVAWLVPNWVFVLCGSGLTLAAGLAAIYRPRCRRPAVVVPLAAVAVLAAVAFPTAAPLAIQAAVPGCLLAAGAAALRRLFDPGEEPATRAGVAQSASSLTRTAPPTVSLIVSPSVADRGPAAAGRDAS